METLTKDEEFIVRAFSTLTETEKELFLAYMALSNIENTARRVLESLEKFFKGSDSKGKNHRNREPDEPQTLSEAELSLLATSTKNDDSWEEQEWTEYPTFNSVDVNGGDGGYIYAAEYGEYIKIGYTVSPKTRLGNHAATAKNYGNITTGRVLLSPPHKSYQKTEKLLHEYFKACRKDGTELFEVPFDELKAQIRGAIAEIKEAQE